jgi:hypothetical protein
VLQQSWRISHVSNTLLCAFYQISLWGKYKEGVMAGTSHKAGTDEKSTQLYPESLKGKDSLKNLQTYNKHVNSTKINASGILGLENISFGRRSCLRIFFKPVGIMNTGIQKSRENRYQLRDHQILKELFLRSYSLHGVTTA